MELIPAIDLKDGHCVRLKQGRMDDDTVFSEDPVAVADHWVKQGARRLHLVDLNGAFAGEPVNGEIVNAIARAHPGLPIQIGGGIRSAETIQAYLDAGVQWVIIGTKAVKEPQFVRDMCKQFPGHVIVGLDAKDGKVATDGWAEVTDIDVVDLARQFEHDGVVAIVYTDISRDGMLQGPNLKSIKEFSESANLPVIASGGVSQLKDIEDLLALEPNGVEGIIIGKALYNKNFTYPQTLELLDRYVG